MSKEPRIVRKYSVYEIDQMRMLLSGPIYHRDNTERTEIILRTYLMAGVSPDELRAQVEIDRAERRKHYAETKERLRARARAAERREP